jgi:hypothetical protein
MPNAMPPLLLSSLSLAAATVVTVGPDDAAA